jgi:hypothetical protein
MNEEWNRDREFFQIFLLFLISSQSHKMIYYFFHNKVDTRREFRSWQIYTHLSFHQTHHNLISFICVNFVNSFIIFLHHWNTFFAAQIWALNFSSFFIHLQIEIWRIEADENWEIKLFGINTFNMWHIFANFSVIFIILTSTFFLNLHRNIEMWEFIKSLHVQISVVF